MMIHTLTILIAGLAFIILGADWLIDGASSIARKSGISEFVIGLTIVGFGTSCPELVVSLTGALQGNAGISIGNVLGSNVFNTLLILGITAMIMPVSISAGNRKTDIPIMNAITLLFIVTGVTGNVISMIEGILFLLIFTAYVFFSFKTGSETPAPSSEQTRTIGVPKSVLLVSAGLAGLIFGGKWFVNGAEELARMSGVSDKFIAVTLLAGGTSLPELATCIVAAAKKKAQLALGNIIGSNVFNILLILGLSATITPLGFSDIGIGDIIVLAASSLLLPLFALTGTKNKLDRSEGAIMVALWLCYLIWLFHTA